jgi:hypothetical protein
MERDMATICGWLLVMAVGLGTARADVADDGGGVDGSGADDASGGDDGAGADGGEDTAAPADDSGGCGNKDDAAFTSGLSVGLGLLLLGGLRRRRSSSPA